MRCYTENISISEVNYLLIPIIVSLVISVSWLLHRSILIAYKKDLLKVGREWLSTRSILVPVLAVFFLPMITAYLTLNPVPEILKLILPLLTFMTGQSLGRYEKQNEFKNKQIEVLLIIRRKFSIAREKISLNKRILELELDSINNKDKGFIERRLKVLDGVTEEFLKLDTFLTLTNENLLNINDLFNLRKLSIIIDEFNELAEERTDYREKCRESTSNSVNQYYCLLENTDNELLKLAKSFEQLLDQVSEVDVICRS